jgi:small conductance mechanosensitive channel
MSLQSFFKNLAAPLLALWPRLVFAGAILILGLGVAIVVQKAIFRLLRRATPEIRLFAGRLAYIGIVIGAILGALAALGVHIAAMATLIGALGLAVSLSLQDTARNLVAGLYLLAEHPFHVGDQITVRTFTGRVELIDMRTTTLRTDDDQQVIIPNTIIMSEVVVRQSDEEPAGNQHGQEEV